MAMKNIFFNSCEKSSEGRPGYKATEYPHRINTQVTIAIGCHGFNCGFLALLLVQLMARPCPELQFPNCRGNPPHDWRVYSSPVQLRPSEFSRRGEETVRGGGGREREREGRGEGVGWGGRGGREGEGGGGHGWCKKSIDKYKYLFSFVTI